jgi:hypothetical protein
MAGVSLRRAVRPGMLGRATAHIEPLESRQFLSASLQVVNNDILPGAERMIFNRIQIPNATIPNYVKDHGFLQLKNVGNATLTLSGLAFTGPFKLVGTLPSSIPAGKSVVLNVQFTATKPPAYTYNQTSGFNAASSGGTYIGSMKFKTNDPANATYTEELAGWFQTHSENNEEPNLQTLINKIANYKTNIASSRMVVLSETDTKAVYYGEESVNAYWQVANSAKPVSVRQLASLHTQGDLVTTDWYRKSDKAIHNIFNTDGVAGQSFLPYKQGQKGVPAFGQFSPGTSVFGFHILNEWSDDKMNTKRTTGGGHHVRFYPARDHNGNILANTYIMTMDYSQVGMGKTQNYDFQDNVYLVNNIKPAGN